MPIYHEVYHDLRLIVSRHLGVVDDDEFLDSYEKDYDSDIGRSYDRLVDLGAADSRVRSVQALRTLSRVLANAFDGRQQGPKTAIFAPSELSFGLSRLHEALSSLVPVEFAVFQDLNEALGWLGAPEVLVS